MNPLDLIWVFFLLSAVQPVLKQRLLESSRQRLISKIERQRKSRIVLLAHPQDATLILADQAEKATLQVRESVRELLAGKIPTGKDTELARLLSEGTWTHDHPITYETAKCFGLPVRSDIPNEFLDQMGLYPQPVRHQPTVEYLPERRYSDEGFRKAG